MQLVTLLGLHSLRIRDCDQRRDRVDADLRWIGVVGGQRQYLVGQVKPHKSISRPCSLLGHFVTNNMAVWRSDWVKGEMRVERPRRKAVNRTACSRERAAEGETWKANIPALVHGRELQCDGNIAMRWAALGMGLRGTRLAVCLVVGPLAYSAVTCSQSPSRTKTLSYTLTSPSTTPTLPASAHAPFDRWPSPPAAGSLPAIMACLRCTSNQSLPGPASLAPNLP